MWQAILKIYSYINVFIGFLNISNKGNALKKNKVETIFRFDGAIGEVRRKPAARGQ